MGEDQISCVDKITEIGEKLKKIRRTLGCVIRETSEKDIFLDAPYLQEIFDEIEKIRMALWEIEKIDKQ